MPHRTGVVERRWRPTLRRVRSAPVCFTFTDIEFVEEAYELKGREQHESTAMLLGRASADLQGAQSLGWIAWHRFGAVALRVLIVWVYNYAGTSVLAAVLLHTTDNIGWLRTPINGFYYDPGFTAPITAVAAVIVAFLWVPKTLARYRDAGPATHQSTLDGGGIVR